MTGPVPDILVLTEPVTREALKALVARFFEDMVKYVVDVERGIAAVGYYPGRGPDECIEFTSLINIRPSLGNPSMEIQVEEARARVRDITFALLGRGEALP